MYYKRKKGEKIYYYDFTSLYPFVNYTTTYPLGHPTRQFHNEKVDWKCSADVKKFFKTLELPPMLFKCFLVPGKETDGTLVPVLPAKFDDDGRLLFPLCMPCAVSYDHKEDEDEDDYEALLRKPKRHNIKEDHYECKHSDQERGWVGTYTQLELLEALDRGYKVEKLLWTWTWNKSSDNLFKDYVRTFYKIKTEASWNDKENSIEERDALIKKYKEVYDIDLDPAKMKLNPGMRYISKLCLNSMWGRWSLRNNLTKSEITNDPATVSRLLNDDRIEIVNIRTVPIREDEEREESITDFLGDEDMDSEEHSNNRFVDDEARDFDEDEDDHYEVIDVNGRPVHVTICNKLQTYIIDYRKKKPFVKEHDTSSVGISLFTTSAARVHLFRAMAKVEDSGCKLLYTDTDSLIFVVPEEKENPLETGTLLGELTDEYPNEEIVEYYSPGPKQYMLVLEEQIEDEAKNRFTKRRNVMKIRGLTLDEATENSITPEDFKSATHNIGVRNENGELNETRKTNTYHRIRPNWHGEITSKYFSILSILNFRF